MYRLSKYITAVMGFGGNVFLNKDRRGRLHSPPYCIPRDICQVLLLNFTQFFLIDNAVALPNLRMFL